MNKNRADFLKLYEDVRMSETADSNEKTAWLEEIKKNAKSIMTVAANKMKIPAVQISDIKYVAAPNYRSNGEITGNLDKGGWSAFDKAIYEKIEFKLIVYDFNATKADKVGIRIEANWEHVGKSHNGYTFGTFEYDMKTGDAQHYS